MKKCFLTEKGPKAVGPYSTCVIDGDIAYLSGMVPLDPAVNKLVEGGIEEQAHQVAIVKRAENGMIYDPVTISVNATVKDALSLMAEYHIGGIPVVDDEKKLVGIVTNRDLRFETCMDKPISQVMTSENLVVTTQQTDMELASTTGSFSILFS